MKIQFFNCSHCGNIITVISEDSSLPISCCGEDTQEVTAGASDAAYEKHIPVYRINGQEVTVSVGEAEHPMTDGHYINWVCMETENGFQLKTLKPGMSPVVSFSLSKGDKIKAIYAFCNLHSLWKA